MTTKFIEPETETAGLAVPDQTTLITNAEFAALKQQLSQPMIVSQIKPIDTFLARGMYGITFLPLQDGHLQVLKRNGEFFNLPIVVKKDQAGDFYITDEGLLGGEVINYPTTLTTFNTDLTDYLKQIKAKLAL